MNTFAFLSLSSAVICFILCNFIFYLDKKNLLNRIYAFYCLALSHWAFCEFMWRQAESLQTAYFWIKVNSTWVFVPVLTLHFILVFTEKIKAHRKKLIPLYLLALFILTANITTDLITTRPVKRPWGYTYGIPEISVFYWIVISLSFLQVFVSCYLLFSYYFRIERGIKKTRTKFIMLGINVPIIFAALEALLPVLGRNITELTTASFAVLAVFIGYGIKRYELFALNPVTAAENIFNLISDYVLLADREGKIVSENPALLTFSGYVREELSGKLPELLFSSEKKNFTEDRKAEFIETELAAKNGNKIPVLLTRSEILDQENNIIGRLYLARDITEKRTLENARLKMERLESIGVLAGGIAHDYNNLLVGILGNISLLKESHILKAEDYETVRDVEKAALRAKDLSAQLLTFAKGGKPIKEILSIQDLVKESINLCLRGTNITSEVSFQEKLCLINADKGQLGQVLNNLLINARQAMPEGGRIGITAENYETGNKPELPVGPGHYIKITVRDTGAGISRENINKIFDPYFTTKKTGSGLGLSIVYSVIKKHNGYLKVESEEGLGTVFYIFLPAMRETVMPKQPVREEKKILSDGKSRKVLVLDDEEMLYKLSRKILQKHGRLADWAKTGEEAVALYKKALAEGNKYQAVILDLTIPGGLGGKDTMQELLKLDPEAYGIVSSGYSNDPVLVEYQKYGFKDFLAKPFTVEEFLKKIN